MNDEWRATYRLQVNGSFPLAAAESRLPYLARMGISHVYLSPCLQAAPGSDHGYDVTDPTRISADLGGEEAWHRFGTEARRLGLGVLLDVVPNHMAASEQNPWWDDLLAHGPFSSYRTFFDVVPERGARWRVHLPVLGDDYGAILASRGFSVDLGSGRPRLRRDDRTWPITPSSWRHFFPEGEFPDALQNDLTLVPAGEPTDEDGRRYGLAAAAARRWLDARREAAAHGAREVAENPEHLDAVLEEQWYGLHYWKREGEIANYRRFFDVGSLAALRAEEPEVFAASHARVAKLVRDGEIQGIRVDHPDGLTRPREYLLRLRELLPAGMICVEKILENEEHLRRDWPVDGTVGYDFLSKVNRLWMDGQKSDALSSIYADFTGHSVNLPKVVREKKAQIIEDLFNADLGRLTDLALRIARSSWRTRDLSRAQVRTALLSLTILMPVYRTYLDGRPVDPNDRDVLTGVFAQSRAQAPGVDRAVFDFLEECFVGASGDPARRELVDRWQQMTPAVTAKGVEDTAYYCYDRLVSCNEVGAQASALGISSEKFHEFCHHLAENWPRTLLATSTHDNKRSEDVRARISVLTEDTARWDEALQEWMAMNQPAWRGRAPDRHLEYLLYQTLVGAWPIDRMRAWDYLRKAIREAKIMTSWREPNQSYETTIEEFVASLYASPPFLASMEKFVAPLVLSGRINGLAQTLIKLTAPGVPDLYQGSELWDLSLVDPDNRRPVDFDARERLLERLPAMAPSEALAEWDAGLPKIWLIQRALELRRNHPAWFGPGANYQPLTARGSRVANLLAFVRSDSVLTLVPRFSHTLRGDWGDTRIALPPGKWRSALSGSEAEGEVSPAVLLRDFPVALLYRQS
ncbi:MAG TPA: malto-oligosyltrehalose synthase [Candidatus Didemnitutus sp.]|jgi:(1->4)-alpha-D-glucan 1-alpha-D-glucosylmutase